MDDGVGTNEAAESATAVRDRITDAVFALNTDWEFTYVDDRAAEAFDLADRAVIGRSIWLILPEMAGTGFQDRCLEAMETDRSVRVEQTFPSTGNRYAMRIYPDESGVTVCARERSGESVAVSRSGRTVAETVTDAVVTIDADSTIRSANSATTDLFGYAPSELVGESLQMLMPDDLATRHQAAVERFLDTGEQTMAWRAVELPGVRKDGEEIELSISFGAHAVDGDPRFTGVIREVTARKRRERALRDANDVIADGDLAFDEQVQALLEVARNAVETRFATLSKVVDGEYRFDAVISPPDADVRSGETIPVDATNCERVIEREETLAFDDIAADAPALADRAGNVELGTACYLGTPVVVDGEAQGTFCFSDTDPRDEPFTEWQVAFVEHLGAWVSNEIERRRYVDRLAALDELNQVVQAVADEAVSQPTRAEIERRTCEAIAATDSFQFAWIGEADPGSQTVESRTEAGVDGYTSSISISVDPSQPEGEGPTGRAFRTGEVQTVRNVAAEPTYEPWQDNADDFDFRSSAAIPIVHEGTVYGVLNVYTDRVDAFSSEEYDVVGLLGKIVGHAIASIDRKQVLLADAVLDLEFRVSDVFERFDADLPAADQIRLNAVVPRQDDEYVVFGTTDGDPAIVEALVEHDSSWETLLHVDETDDGVSFEILLTDPPILSAISGAGGRFVEAIVDDGDLHVQVQLPHDADARELLDGVRESYPGTTLVSKQEVSATESSARPGARIALDDLTERRLEALRTAYHAGYFEWPRESSGEAVAELLDVSPPTFSQHLRAAEQSVFERLFEESGDDGPR